MRKWLRKLIGRNPAKVMVEIGKIDSDKLRGDDNMTKKVYEVKGEEYIVVDREVKEGDLIVITSRNEQSSGSFYDVGHIGKVIEVYSPSHIRVDFTGFNNSFVDDDGKWFVGDDNEGDFVVIEKKVNPSPQSDRDLIVELAYTVAKLERKVGELEERELNNGENILNLRDWYRQVDEKAEMLIDDVVMLDERTQPLTDDGAKEFAEGLSDVIEDYVNDRITRDQIRRAYD